MRIGYIGVVTNRALVVALCAFIEKKIREKIVELAFRSSILMQMISSSLPPEPLLDTFART